MPKSSMNVLRLVFFILLIALGGCQARIQDNGTLIKPEDLDKIVVGVTDFREVRRLLGPATVVNTFQKRRWIYIQDRRYKNMQRTFSRAANRVEITFTPQGIVENIERNFGDELIDPENDPNATIKSKWGSWFWKGEYEQPATTQETPSDGVDRPDEVVPPEVGSDANTDVTAPEGSEEKPDEEQQPAAEAKKPWWRFF
ncbi:MAG: outer membrane protein assembly factor BamE [Magnetococcales bacterium]|nr:outer membrane protein assembly factor BamE [Magnetococcales bacterium]